MNNQELQFYGSGEDLDSLRKALAKTGVQESHDEVIKASGDLIPHSVTFIVSAGIVALIREFLKSRSKRMVSRMVSKGEEKITIRGDFSTEEFEKLLKVSYSINIEDDKSLPPNDLKRISVTAKRGDEQIGRAHV